MVIRKLHLLFLPPMCLVSIMLCKPSFLIMCAQKINYPFLLISKCPFVVRIHLNSSSFVPYTLHDIRHNFKSPLHGKPSILYSFQVLILHHVTQCLKSIFVIICRLGISLKPSVVILLTCLKYLCTSFC